MSNSRTTDFLGIAVAVGLVASAFVIGNALKDFGRKSARRQIMPLDEGVRDGGGDPHDHAEATEVEARLALGLMQLPRLQREVFLLRAQQGLEYDEIAAALATTPGAARVHYHHAVRRLKEIVE